MSNKEYDTIVISGGALKGFAVLGCLQCLVDQQKLNFIKKYIGTSIGAIISYLLCIGYTPIEIMVHLCKNDWMKKMAHFDILNAVNGGGAISFSIINEILEKMTIEKIGKFVTLGEIHKTYGKQLICCAFNMTKQDQEFLNPIDNPDLPCLVALRMTSNLPILFEPFLYNSCYYIDGGVFCNFPIFYSSLDNDHVIGIKFKKKAEISMKPFMPYLYDLITIPSRFIEDHLNKHYNHFDIIEIDVNDLSSLNFQMSMNDRLEMFSSGYESAKKNTS
jgi:NTE family protein